MRTRQLHSGWRKKVDPAFVRWWSATKANRALMKISYEKKRDAVAKLNWKEMCTASRDLNEARKKIKNL